MLYELEPAGSRTDRAAARAVEEHLEETSAAPEGTYDAALRRAGAVRVRPSLRMERDDIRTSIGKILHILVNRRDHQMHVKWLITMRA